MTDTVLRIDASARREGSVSRDLADRVLDRLTPSRVIRRDLADALPPIDAAWIAAARADGDRSLLALSDTLIDEIRAADTLVIGLPIYNFAAPAAFKTWVDHVARAGVTFRYTDTGPVGLLTGKRAIVAVASGGTRVGSEIDHATGWVRHVLSFLGIDDVTFVSADAMAIDPEATLAAARADIDRLAA
jgi:FMN-dependent NADH-azoreductase